MNKQIHRFVNPALVLLIALAGCAREAEPTSATAAQPTSSGTAQMESAPGPSPSDPDADGVNGLHANHEAETSTANEPATRTAAPLDEKQILADANGQWATTAKASSTYAQTPDLKAGYSAWQATDAPNVDRYSDSPQAWASKSGDSTVPEWLEGGFAKPVHATSIRIRQTAAPGAISRIELIDESDVAHTIWEGVDDTPYVKDTIGWLVKDVPKTSHVVKGARITLETARVWGWNEIDAVQLVGEE